MPNPQSCVLQASSPVPLKNDLSQATPPDRCSPNGNEPDHIGEGAGGVLVCPVRFRSHLSCIRNDIAALR